MDARKDEKDAQIIQVCIGIAAYVDYCRANDFYPDYISVNDVAIHSNLHVRETQNALNRAITRGLVKAIQLRCIKQGYGWKSKYEKRFYHLTASGKQLVESNSAESNQ